MKLKPDQDLDPFSEQFGFSSTMRTTGIFDKHTRSTMHMRNHRIEVKWMTHG